MMISSSIYKILAILGLLSTITFGVLWEYKRLSYDNLEASSKVLEANNKILEIQKDAMVTAIGIQNAEIDKHKIDEKKNLEIYAIALQSTADDFNLRIKQTKGLSGESECKYIRGVINEIINR